MQRGDDGWLENLTLHSALGEALIGKNIIDANPFGAILSTVDRKSKFILRAKLEMSRIHIKQVHQEPTDFYFGTKIKTILNSST